MSPIKQINDNFIAEQTVVASDQLYGPILPDGSCPTIHGIKQVPSHVANYSVCGPACQGQEACPPAPASGQPYCFGTPNGTKETYSCHVDCFNKGDADCQKGAVCVCTWFRLCVCFYDNGK
ncbi:hypothetical protein FOZ63_031728 [Perkinsus olseni]|nr:hypothetical protein FOZ63_031728 [Perkinsus olseni]